MNIDKYLTKKILETLIVDKSPAKLTRLSDFEELFKKYYPRLNFEPVIKETLIISTLVTSDLVSYINIDLDKFEQSAGFHLQSAIVKSITADFPHLASSITFKILKQLRSATISHHLVSEVLEEMGIRKLHGGHFDFNVSQIINKEGIEKVKQILEFYE